MSGAINTVKSRKHPSNPRILVSLGNLVVPLVLSFLFIFLFPPLMRSLVLWLCLIKLVLTSAVTIYKRRRACALFVHRLSRVRAYASGWLVGSNFNPLSQTPTCSRSRSRSLPLTQEFKTSRVYTIKIHKYRKSRASATVFGLLTLGIGGIRYLSIDYLFSGFLITRLVEICTGF